uniref:Vitellogenin domain-containing protein n=1 Tax=Megaselia scalaris TaxID=36166 RepID=T1GCS0_MEGSC
MKLTFLAICLMAFGIGADQCPLSIGCSSSKSPYISGSVYYYEFESLYDLKTTRQGDADETNAKITGTAKIYSNGDCSFTLQLENVFVSSQKENIRKMLGSEEVPVKFNMNGLGVINSQICVDASDNDYSLNLKRSIISLFASGEQKYETDLFGVCQTEKNIMPRKQITIKNLNKCSHRENFNLIKGVVDEQSGVHTSPLLHGNYIRESEFNENKVLNVNLKEIYIFGDKNSGLVEVKVSTNLKFLKSNYVKNADVLKKQFKKTVENFEDFVKFGSTENFVELLRLMRHSNTEALIDLSPVNEEGLARKIYLDALFRTGTSKSLSAILRQIPKMKENEKKMAYLSFYLIEDVTKENLNQAVDLVTNAAPKESYLALGHLVSKLCSRQSSLCNDSYLSRVTKKFTDSLKKCKSQTKTDEDKIVFILKGIKNSKKIGSSIASTLQLCSQAGSTRIRVASLQAFSSATCNADLQSKALSLLQNINEDSEIRIESYIALLHCPSAELANNIEKLVNNEPSNQVGTFISTHLRALKESNDKSKEAQKYYMQNIRVTKKLTLTGEDFLTRTKFYIFLEIQMDNIILICSLSVFGLIFAILLFLAGGYFWWRHKRSQLQFVEPVDDEESVSDSINLPHTVIQVNQEQKSEERAPSLLKINGLFNLKAPLIKINPPPSICSDGSSVIHLHVFDYDRFSRDDSIGEVFMPVCQKNAIHLQRQGCNSPSTSQVLSQSSCPIPEQKPHQCQQCLKSFSSNHQLVQHIRVHTGEKPYKCSYCDRRFKQLSHVQQHTRLHTGERPYKCHLPECGRAFIQLSNLQQHLRNHDAQVERAKNRPFHCNICGKGFATSLQHAALIGGTNATTCPVCHKLFLGAEALMEHMKTMHNHGKVEDIDQKPSLKSNNPESPGSSENYLAKRRSANHPCPICGKHYVNEGSLRKHLACHPETAQLTNNLRMWPCSVCQAVFTNEGGLLSHMDHMRMDPKHQFAAQYVLSRAAAERREQSNSSPNEVTEPNNNRTEQNNMNCLVPNKNQINKDSTDYEERIPVLIHGKLLDNNNFTNHNNNLSTSGTTDHSTSLLPFHAANPKLIEDVPYQMQQITILIPLIRRGGDLLFDVSLKFFGSEMFFLSLDNFEKFNMNNLLFKTEKKIETHSLFLDNRIIYPTGMGFPLELSAQGMSANKIEFDYNRLDNKWLLKIIPSFDVSISASISVDFSVFKNGLKISSEAHSATGVDAELLIDKNTIDNMSSVMGNINSLYGNLTNKISKRSTNTQSNEKFILTLNIPRSKLNIFEFKHSIAFIHQEPDKEEKKTLLKPKKKRNSQDQCFEQLLMFGAKLCYRADFSDFEYSDFFLTLSLENKLNLLVPMLMMHTTKLTTSLGLIPNTFARIELELANINKLFALELGLNNNENEKSLYFKQSENSQVTVYKAGLTKSSNEYYPVLEVDINGHKEPSIAGYRVYGKVIISGDIYILQNIKLTSPSTEITTLDGKISVGKEVIQTDLKLNKKTSLKCTLDLSGNPVYKLGLFIDENGAELHFGNGEIGGLIKGGDTNVKLSSKFDKEKIDIHLEWTNKNAKYLEILLSGRKNADISELTISFEKSGGKSAGLTFAISKDVEFKGRAFVNRHSIEIKGKKNGNKINGLLKTSSGMEVSINGVVSEKFSLNEHFVELQANNEKYLSDAVITHNSVDVFIWNADIHKPIDKVMNAKGIFKLKDVINTSITFKFNPKNGKGESTIVTSLMEVQDEIKIGAKFLSLMPKLEVETIVNIGSEKKYTLKTENILDKSKFSSKNVVLWNSSDKKVQLDIISNFKNEDIHSEIKLTIPEKQLIGKFDRKKTKSGTSIDFAINDDKNIFSAYGKLEKHQRNAKAKIGMASDFIKFDSNLQKLDNVVSFEFISEQWNSIASVGPNEIKFKLNDLQTYHNHTSKQSKVLAKADVEIENKKGNWFIEILNFNEFSGKHTGSFDLQNIQNSKASLNLEFNKKMIYQLDIVSKEEKLLIDIKGEKGNIVRGSLNYAINQEPHKSFIEGQGELLVGEKVTQANFKIMQQIFTTSIDGESGVKFSFTGNFEDRTTINFIKFSDHEVHGKFCLCDDKKECANVELESREGKLLAIIDLKTFGVPYEFDLKSKFKQELLFDARLIDKNNKEVYKVSSTISPLSQKLLFKINSKEFWIQANSKLPENDIYGYYEERLEIGFDKEEKTKLIWTADVTEKQLKLSWECINPQMKTLYLVLDIYSIADRELKANIICMNMNKMIQIKNVETPAREVGLLVENGNIEILSLKAEGNIKKFSLKSSIFNNDIISISSEIKADNCKFVANVFGKENLIQFSKSEKHLRANWDLKGILLAEASIAPRHQITLKISEKGGIVFGRSVSLEKGKLLETTKEGDIDQLNKILVIIKDDFHSTLNLAEKNILDAKNKIDQHLDQNMNIINKSLPDFKAVKDFYGKKVSDISIEIEKDIGNIGLYFREYKESFEMIFQSFINFCHEIHKLVTEFNKLLCKVFTPIIESYIDFIASLVGEFETLYKEYEDIRNLIPTYNEIVSKLNNSIGDFKPSEQFLELLHSVLLQIKSLAPETTEFCDKLYNYFQKKLSGEKVDDFIIIKELLNILKTSLPLEYHLLENISEIDYTSIPKLSLSIFKLIENLPILHNLHLTGHILPSGGFISFDGKFSFYNKNCKLIFAQEYTNNNFTVLGNIKNGQLKSISLVEKASTIEILDNGNVKVNGKNVEWPVVIAGKVIALKEWNKFTIKGLESNVEINCFNSLKYCHVTVSYKYTGKLRGILGNGNGEVFDDFILPNGHIAESEDKFFAAYGIGSLAFPFINNIGFKSACGIISKCDIAFSYVSAANLRRIPIVLPTECLKCEEKKDFGEEFAINIPTNKADVVFIIDLDVPSQVLQDLVVPTIANTQNDLKDRNFNDINVGIVGYTTKYPEPIILSANIENFSINEPKLNYFEQLFPNLITKSDEKAFELAMRYPFRALATKTIIVIRADGLVLNIGNVGRAILYSAAAEMRGILLQVVQPVSGLSEDVIGFNSKLIVPLKGPKDAKKRANLKYTPNVSIENVLQSGGWVFDFNKFTALSNANDKKSFVHQLTSSIAENLFRTEISGNCKCLTYDGLTGVNSCLVIKNINTSKKINLVEGDDEFNIFISN